MDPVDIKAAIQKAGTTQAAIAEELGVSPVTVHQVIKGTTHSRRIASHIARIIRRPMKDIWPDQYGSQAA